MQEKTVLLAVASVYVEPDSVLMDLHQKNMQEKSRAAVNHYSPIDYFHS